MHIIHTRFHGFFLAYAAHYKMVWYKAGWQPVTIIVSDNINIQTLEGFDFSHSILVRQNRGYDFAGWADAIQRLRPQLAMLQILAIVYNSVFGPLASVITMLNMVEATESDVIRVTDSYGLACHYQSYLLFLKNRVLQIGAFNLFWRRIEIGNRDFVIDNYKVRFLGMIREAGLCCAALFPTSPELLVNLR